MRNFLLRYCVVVACLLAVQVCIAPPAPFVTSISVGFNPNGIAVTPDGKYAYVANNNNNSVPGGDTVSVINLSTNRVVATISLPALGEPYTVTINAAGTKVYVTNSNSTTVSVIDTATNTITATITGFDGPSGFAIRPNSNFAYVNNYGAGFPDQSGFGTTVRVVDLNTNTIVGAAITVGQAPAALAATPDGAFIYVANYVDGNPGTGTMSVIRTSDNTVVATIPGFSGPFDIAITPNGKRAYVTNFGSNNFSPVGRTVTVVDLTTNTVVDTIIVGIQPSGVAITPDGKYAYVSNYYTLYLGPNFTNLTAFQGTVNIIRTCDNTVLPFEINVGSSPAKIAIAPNGTVYVTNYTSNNVSVIEAGRERMWLASLNRNCCN